MPESLPKHVTVRVYEELNAFLAPERQKTDFCLDLAPEATAETLLSKLHIPVQAVDLILVNGDTAALDRTLEAGERISIYPVFESMDITEFSRMEHAPLRRPRFIIKDRGLETVALMLRLLGLDVIDPSLNPPTAPSGSSSPGGRILITASPTAFSENPGSHKLLLKNPSAEAAVLEVIARLDLYPCLHPLTRCPFCNRPFAQPASAVEAMPRCEKQPERSLEAALAERFEQLRKAVGGC